MAGLYPDNQDLSLFGEQVTWPGVDPATGKFTNGSFSNPLVKPSFIPAETINLILDNLAALITAMGGTPNNTAINQLTQLFTAAAIANKGILRDANGRAKVADPINTLDIANLKSIYYRMAQTTMACGGNITFDGTYLKWDLRVMCIPADRSIAPGGYIALEPPTVGTTVYGTNDQPYRYFTESGICINTFDMLICRIPTYKYYIIDYTSIPANFLSPDDLIIAYRGDGVVAWFNGFPLTPGQYLRAGKITFRLPVNPEDTAPKSYVDTMVLTRSWQNTLWFDTFAVFDGTYFNFGWWDAWGATWGGMNGAARGTTGQSTGTRAGAVVRTWTDSGITLNNTDILVYNFQDGVYYVFSHNNGALLTPYDLIIAARWENIIILGNGLTIDVNHSIADRVYVDATRAPKNSPALTGIPTAPTAATETNNTQIATTAFVQAQKNSPVFTGTPKIQDGNGKQSDIACVNDETDRDATDLPVGSYVLTVANVATVYRNYETPIFLSTSSLQRYEFNGSGSPLLGVWRASGDVPGGYLELARRTRL